MNIESVDYISPATGFTSLLNSGTESTEKGQRQDFVNFIDQQITSLNNELETSDAKLRELATGETANLHDVMLSLEKAKLSMELLIQVRNKALEAYQELMRTQI